MGLLGGLGGLRGTGAALLARAGRRALVRKRLPSLPAKFGPRFYYKGNRARRLGRATRKGAYVIDWRNRVPEYCPPPPPPPDEQPYPLRPYVSARTPKFNIPPPPVPRAAAD